MRLQKTCWKGKKTCPSLCLCHIHQALYNNCSTQKRNQSNINTTEVSRQVSGYVCTRNQGSSQWGQYQYVSRRFTLGGDVLKNDQNKEGHWWTHEKGIGRGWDQGFNMWWVERPVLHRLAFTRINGSKVDALLVKVVDVWCVKGLWLMWCSLS